MKRKIGCLLLVLIIFFSCATPYQRLQNKYEGRVDQASITDLAKYQADYDYCTNIAVRLEQQAIQEAQSRAVGGAIFGGLMGAALGGIIGGHNWVGQGAAAGAVSGAGSGVATTPVHSDEAFCHCMENRGYKLYW